MSSQNPTIDEIARAIAGPNAAHTLKASFGDLNSAPATNPSADAKSQPLTARYLKYRIDLAVIRARLSIALTARYLKFQVVLTAIRMRLWTARQTLLLRQFIEMRLLLLRFWALEQVIRFNYIGCRLLGVPYP